MIKATSTGAAFSYYVSDYDEVKGKDSTYLQGHPRVQRYVHNGDWMGKISPVINREATDKDEKVVKQFMKNIMKKTRQW